MQKSGFAQAVIENMTGQIVMRFQISEGIHSKTLDLKGLPIGMYILQVSNSDGSYTEKIILEK